MGSRGDRVGPMIGRLFDPDDAEKLLRTRPCSHWRGAGVRGLRAPRASVPPPQRGAKKKKKKKKPRPGERRNQKRRAPAAARSRSPCRMRASPLLFGCVGPSKPRPGRDFDRSRSRMACLSASLRNQGHTKADAIVAGFLPLQVYRATDPCIQLLESEPRVDGMMPSVETLAEEARVCDRIGRPAGVEKSPPARLADAGARGYLIDRAALVSTSARRDGNASLPAGGCLPVHGRSDLESHFAVRAGPLGEGSVSHVPPLPLYNLRAAGTHGRREPQPQASHVRSLPVGATSWWQAPISPACCCW